MQTESRPPESIATTDAGGAIRPPARMRSSRGSASISPVSRSGTGGADHEQLGREREALEPHLADRLQAEALVGGDRLRNPIGDQHLAGEGAVDDPVGE